MGISTLISEIIMGGEGIVGARDEGIEVGRGVAISGEVVLSRPFLAFHLRLLLGRHPFSLSCCIQYFCPFKCTENYSRGIDSFFSEKENP